MSPALLALITQIIQLAIAVVPSVIQEAQLAISLLESGTDPTPDQIAQIDAALDKVKAELDAAAAAQLAVPTE